MLAELKKQENYLLQDASRCQSLKEPGDCSKISLQLYDSSALLSAKEEVLFTKILAYADRTKYMTYW